MRARWVKKGSRERVMVRTNTVKVLNKAMPALEQLGMEEVGIVAFLKHILFWWVKRNRE
jgi:hypothetical protein